MKRLESFLLGLLVFGATGLAQKSQDEINIIFKHDFENNSPGIYNDTEWRRDWLNPAWSNREVPPVITLSENPDNPTKVMQWNFPAGSLGPSEGGGQWETKLGKSYEELYFSYDILFKEGFDFVLGGKIPGVYGGPQVYLNRPGWSDGFGATMMFKQLGRLVFYTYSQGQPGQYGETSSWDKYVTPGKWHNITIRVVMNSVSSEGGNRDGIMEAFFDGKLVYGRKDMLFRNLSSIGIDGLRIYSHFGGATDDWRNPRDEYIQLDNFIAYTFKDEHIIPSGIQPSEAGRTINYWRNMISVAETNPDPQIPEEPEITEPETNLPVETPVVINQIPTIKDQSFTIDETSFINNNIGTVIATDPDPGQQLRYFIISGNTGNLFHINENTGFLSTTSNAIFGPYSQSFKLTISATDNALEPESANATIHVTFASSSNTVYIDPDHKNDEMANGSINHPFSSWTDITWKEGYTYLQKRGTISYLDKILVGANNVKLASYGEGELPIISSNTNTYLISGFEKAGISLSQLNLQAPNAVSSVYFLGNSGDSIIIEHCQLSANVNAIKVASGNTLIIRYNSISSNGEGVYSSSNNNQVYYNIFKNCREAINIIGNKSIAKIYNNVFYNNQESLSVTYADLTLFNNIFYLNSPGQSAINYGSGNIQSNNNIYYPEQAGFITIANTVFNNLEQLQQAMNIDMNSFTSDPAFVDIYNDNFLLAEGSPAINAGIDLNLGTDLLGSSVPLSGSADIGVHEFTGVIVPQEYPSNQSMRLYPNPSTGRFNVMAEFQSEQDYKNKDVEKSELRVTDLSGKVVFAKQVDQLAMPTYYEQIDLTGIANGIYLVVLEIAGKLTVNKISINK